MSNWTDDGYIELAKASLLAIQPELDPIVNEESCRSDILDYNSRGIKGFSANDLWAFDSGVIGRRVEEKNKQKVRLTKRLNEQVEH